MNTLYLLSATLLMAGCASPYGMDVADAGGLPMPPGQTLQFSASADPVLAQRVTAALASRGFKVAEPANYLVQIASSDLPPKTGAFLPERAPDASGEQAWLTKPSRRGRVQTHRVTVTLTEIATGSEIYRASGDERYRAGEPRGDALIEAVVGQIAAQGAVTPAAAPEE